MTVWTLAMLIALGVIIAGLIIQPTAASTLFGFVNKIYTWAVNSMMGTT